MLHNMTMNDILILKEKHTKTAELRINDLFQNQLNFIDRVNNEAIERCNEDEITVKDLTSKVTSIKENLQVEKQTLEHKANELAKYLGCIAELEAEKKKFLEENHLLELQRSKLKACKSNVRDEELLTRGRRKFTLYKQTTGIRWDYERLKESVTGYICNEKKTYIRHFSYQKENTTNLSNLLWEEIHKSIVCVENKGAHEKENIVQNQIL